MLIDAAREFRDAVTQNGMTVTLGLATPEGIEQVVTLGPPPQEQ